VAKEDAERNSCAFSVEGQDATIDSLVHRNTGNYRARILLHAGQRRKVTTTARIRSYSFTTAA
jgi:hypothetical protein